MKILLKCSSNDEGMAWCQYALITLSDECKKEAQRRREIFQMGKSRDSGLWEMSYWGIPGDFYDTVDVERLLTEEQQQALETNEYIVLPAQMAEQVSLYAEFFDNLEPARTECDRMVFVDDGFWYECLVKHTEVRVETARLPYEMVL